MKLYGDGRSAQLICFLMLWAQRTFSKLWISLVNFLEQMTNARILILQLNDFDKHYEKSLTKTFWFL